MKKEEWHNLVEEALLVHGIGAKTRLGYETFNFPDIKVQE